MDFVEDHNHILFMFRAKENNKSFKDAIKFFYCNRKESIKILEQITEASIDYAKNQVLSGIEVFNYLKHIAELFHINFMKKLYYHFQKNTE